MHWYLVVLVNDGNIEQCLKENGETGNIKFLVIKKAHLKFCIKGSIDSFIFADRKVIAVYCRVVRNVYLAHLINILSGDNISIPGPMLCFGSDYSI